MKSTFSLSELYYIDDSHIEQVRTRKIFENLKLKAKEDKCFTEHEKDFFCKGLKFSIINDGKLEDYKCCDNHRFKFLYLTHFHDLTGGSPVYKPNNKLLQVTEIDKDEKQKDLKYLYEKSNEWENVIKKTNQKEDLLKEACMEARIELKKLLESPEIKNIPFIKSTFYFEHKKREILLKLKYLYLIALKLFEKINKEDLVLEINSQTIEINEYSLIHILNRHFAAITKYNDTQKSFHNEDFEPEILNNQLRQIFRAIDNTKYMFGQSLHKIVFQFKGIDYQIWTGEKKKFIKGKEINFRRLNTFYPVLDIEEKKKLILNYNFVKINEDINLYLMK